MLSFSCLGQAKNQGTVYAGVKTSVGNGALNRKDVSVLLRNDFTFTDQLAARDWKTAVIGKYIKENGEITLNYTKSKKTVIYKITDKGNLSRRGLVLSKFDEKSMPIGGFKYKNVSGRGGIGTPQDYVGSSTSTIIYFNADGTFTNKKASAVTIVGNNVGGGTTSKKNGAGIYKLNNGELTFNFNDGTTKKHSCFVSKAGGKDNTMLLIDGKFYFVKR